MKQLPPRWPGPVMICAGALGLTFVVNPSAAGVALLCVVLGIILASALAALSAIIAADRADDRMSDEEVEARGRLLADKLREEMSTDHAERSASAVIGDDHP